MRSRIRQRTRKTALLGTVAVVTSIVTWLERIRHTEARHTASS